MIKMACHWILLALSMGYYLTAHADDYPTFNLTMQDGVFLPAARIQVPAGKKIRLLIANKGTSAAEFESLSLRKEKVLGPGANSFVILAALDPGSYDFFDDFHPSAKGVIIAK